MALTTGELRNVLKGARLLGAADATLSGVTHDSNRVAPGDLYCCISGHRSDARQYVSEAVARGAAAVLMEPPAHADAKTQILVPSARESLAHAAEVIYGQPGPREAPCIGITGTNGKTTTAYIVQSILSSAGLAPALVGSIESAWGATSQEARNTTPEAGDLRLFWSRAVAEGAKSLIMETSSHGLLLHRADRIGFNVGVFTNLTRDHLDYHPDLDAYRGAKTRLFGMLPRRGHAILSRDDAAWPHFARATRARVTTFGTSSAADVRALDVAVSAAGIEFELLHKTRSIKLQSRLFGRLNVANIIAAGAVGIVLDLTDDEIIRGVAEMDAVPGRAERVDCGQPFVVLNDFAHTPDALERMLHAARELTTGKLHILFGCGGDRDRGKRPEMGRIAAALADRITVTSDNPRTENPGDILDQIVAPIGPHDSLFVEVDRTAAIAAAIGIQKAGDTLIVAGKGHERYQIIGTTKHSYDDAEVLRNELRRSGYGR